ncbi:DUF397 domain-containing protein [Streptomyces sp. NPDC059255]|uniref:DUF397 domain-containing protein n=1 Tax=Streptomyces sp. NPDC059255 TaxID=3346793 RepID=UPI0036C9498D
MNRELDLPRARWRKSSYSGGDNNCVELAVFGGQGPDQGGRPGRVGADCAEHAPVFEVGEAVLHRCPDRCRCGVRQLLSSCFDQRSMAAMLSAS